MGSGLAHGGSEWENLGEKDGIQTFRKSEAGSSLLIMKGSGVVDAPLPIVYAVFHDAERTPEWMPDTLEKKILVPNSGLHSRIALTRVDMPWPLDDRYFIAESKARMQRDGTLVLRTKSTTTIHYEMEDCVKGEIKYSQTILEPIGSGQTKVTIEMKTDPKGELPAWLVNKSTKSWPYKFISGIRQQVTKSNLKIVELPKPIGDPVIKGPSLIPAAAH